MSKLRRQFWLSIAVVVIVCLSSTTTLMADSCSNGSSIDQVPDFVKQAFTDVLGRTADSQGLNYWDGQLQVLNSRNCNSSNPSWAAGKCEWKNNAQILLNLLNSPESASRNGDLSSNQVFLNTTYKLLLHRQPDQQGLKSHLESLGSGASRADELAVFLTSAEYRNRFPCTSNRPQVMRTAISGNAQLGINGHPITQAVYADSNVSYDQQVSLVRNAGASWYRVDVAAIPTQQWFDKLDLLVARAQAHGVNILPILIPAVDRKQDTPDTAYRKAHDAAVAFVNRYKSSLHVWELSNEEDVYSNMGRSGELTTDYDPQKYALAAAVIRGLSDGVHEADSSAQRIVNFAGWLHTGFLQRIQNDGIGYEIVGVHWYQNMGEITCPGQASPCPARPQHFNVLQRIHDITHGKPMWMTETNYTPSPDNTPEANVAMKEKYLAAALQRYLSAPQTYPFQTIMVYELLDEPNLHSDVTQTQMGMFSVTKTTDGKYALGQAKPEFKTVQGLFGR